MDRKAEIRSGALLAVAAVLLGVVAMGSHSTADAVIGFTAAILSVLFLKPWPFWRDKP